MVVTAISPAAALTKVREALRLSPAPVGDEPDAIMISQALRRAVQILAPCPRHELERAVHLSLKMFSSDREALATSVTEALDTLLAFGDILEMHAPVDDPWAQSRLVVRPAPPAFVVMRSGSVILLGVAGDDISPLSTDMNKQIEWHGLLRTLPVDSSQHLREFLLDLGLLELSERTWLRLPSPETLDSYCSHWIQRLAQSPATTTIDGLQVLDSAKGPRFYKGRWVEPNRTLTGLHVARRLQRYGAPLWCLIELSAGTPIRLLDLAARTSRERPCDVAWRIQMAIDAGRGTPQSVDLHVTQSGTRLSFFSPIPSWAERKLAVVGHRIAPERCLFSYSVPADALNEITEFLKTHLWISSEATTAGKACS